MKKFLFYISVIFIISFSFYNHTRVSEYKTYSLISENYYSKKENEFSIVLYQTISKTNFNYAEKYKYKLITSEKEEILSLTRFEMKKNDMYELYYYFSIPKELEYKCATLEMKNSEHVYYFDIGNIYFIDQNVICLNSSIEFDQLYKPKYIIFSYINNSINDSFSISTDDLYLSYKLKASYEDDYNDSKMLDNVMYKVKFKIDKEYYLKSLIIKLTYNEDNKYYRFINNQINERFLKEYYDKIL